MTTKIKDEDIAKRGVSSLPTRPTVPTAYGGRGYSSDEMKAAFDALPIFLASKINSMIDDAAREGSDSLAAAIPTGISEGHTLADLFSDILSGAILGYITLHGESLFDLITNLRSEVDLLKEARAAE